MKATRPRILIVDDNPDIHEDFQRVLGTDNSAPDLERIEAPLFGVAPSAASASIAYALDHAFQGSEAIEMVRRAKASGNPYGMAFVDVRMPPGMDGVWTIQGMRRIDPNLDCVICTAYSDYTPESAGQKIGISEGLLFISKPFDPEIIRRLALQMLDRFAPTLNRR